MKKPQNPLLYEATILKQKRFYNEDIDDKSAQILTFLDQDSWWQIQSVVFLNYYGKET